MKKYFIVFILFCFVFIKAFAQEGKIKINVLKIFDGDTVYVKNQNDENFSIRLKGIDCYETSKINRAYKQAYLNKISIEDVVKKGLESKNILNEFFHNNQCEFSYVSYGKDKYNRELGVLYCNNINLNEYMMQKGGCYKYVYKN